MEGAPARPEDPIWRIHGHGGGTKHAGDAPSPRHLGIHGRITERQGSVVKGQRELKEFGEGDKIHWKSMPIIGTAHQMLLMQTVAHTTYQSHWKQNGSLVMLYAM